MKRYFTPNKLVFYAFSCSLLLVFYYMIALNILTFDSSTLGNDTLLSSPKSKNREQEYVVELQFDSVLALIGCFGSTSETSFDWSMVSGVANSNQSAFWVLPKFSEKLQINLFRSCVTFCQARHLSTVILNTELCACFNEHGDVLKFFPTYSKSFSCDDVMNITMERTKGQKNKKLIVGANDTLAVYKQLVRIPPTIGMIDLILSNFVLKTHKRLAAAL